VIPAGGPSADLAAYRPVGPTILGVIRRRPAGGGADALHPGVAIEEASTPTALFPLMGSLLATMALPHAYAQGPAIAWWLPFGDLAGRLPAFLAENTRLDPLAASPGIARHSQILLGMCVDRGDGRVSLDPDGRLRIHLQSDPDDAAGGRVHRFLASAHARGGFDGGWYMRNPLWRALPEGFGQVGARAGGRVITVHPLGGCPMGSDADSGVVDHLGRVFDVSPGAAPGAVHPGLHVLDGAIVPVPLGANPLLTISALALRAAREISAALGTPGAPSVRQVPEGAMPARHRQMPPVPAADMTIAFTEVLHTRQGEQLDLGA
jgi:cholesterol oxidase